MSYIVNEFDPSTNGNTTFSAPASAANGCLYFWNESNYSLDLKFQDSTILYLPAWYGRKKGGLVGNVIVNWDVHTVLNSGPVPLSQVIVESYDSDETPPPDGPLVRQTNGNTNSSVTGSTLVNTGNPPMTPIIQITPSDVTTGTYTIYADNSGNFYIQSDNAGTLTQLFNITAGSSPALQLGAATVETEVLGTLKVDGNITGSNSTTFVIGPGSGQLLTVLDNAGNGAFSIKAGPYFDVHRLQWSAQNSDTLAQIHAFTGTGSGTFNHGMNSTFGTPYYFTITPTGDSTSATVGYSNITSTQVTFQLGSSVNWKAQGFMA